MVISIVLKKMKFVDNLSAYLFGTALARLKELADLFHDLHFFRSVIDCRKQGRRELDVPPRAVKHDTLQLVPTDEVLGPVMPDLPLLQNWPRCPSLVRGDWSGRAEHPPSGPRG